MPRQKFCSVPGCLSTTELIKKEQETFLASFCNDCRAKRPCRCPAPDIYTTRKETRNKFNSWCSALGLREPGYYINVCYKHFSSRCPSRASPNPDVVEPVWERHVKEKAAGMAGDSSRSNKKQPTATAAAAAAPTAGRSRHSSNSPVVAAASASMGKPAGGTASSAKVKPTVKRSVVIQQRGRGSPLAAPPPPPPLIARSSSIGSTGSSSSSSSSCSSAASSPIAATPSASTSQQPLISRGGGLVVAPPPPDLNLLLSSIARRQQQPAPAPNPVRNHTVPPQCFLTLTPPPMPSTPISPRNVAAAAAAAATLLPPKDVDLRKLQPLPLPSVTIKVEPDLKKLTPLPLATDKPPMLKKSRPFDVPSLSVDEMRPSTASAAINDSDMDDKVLLDLKPGDVNQGEDEDTGTLSKEAASSDWCGFGDVNLDDEDRIRVVLLDECSGGLLDQSEDPCLNDGNHSTILPPLGGATADSPFTEDPVQKWLEMCEA